MVGADSLLRRNVALAARTTIGIGGPARALLEVKSEPDVELGLRLAAQQGLPVLVLGGGSNLLVSDSGFDGLVLDVALRGVEVVSLERDRVLVRAGAGEEWDSLVLRTVCEGWAGLECLSGIPGKVGATPIQNVGAYGQEVRETVLMVRAYDRHEGRVVEVAAAQCGLDYRTSCFKTQPNRYVILAVTFALRPGGAPAVRYAELAMDLSRTPTDAPRLTDVRDVVLELRRRKAMLVDPDDPHSRSAGSFFLNPIVPQSQADDVERRARALRALAFGEQMPRYSAGAGLVKLAAAWLIERAGFRKGQRHGRAAISEKHTLALVNLGDASADEVLGLARLIQAGVRAAFAVDLVMEPVLVGFANYGSKT